MSEQPAGKKKRRKGRTQTGFRIDAAKVRQDADAETIGTWLHEEVGAPEFTSTDDLMNSIQTGVLLGRLVKKVFPEHAVKINENAEVGSFIARDNLANVLGLCGTLGLEQSSLFTADDLVERKNDGAVLTTLMGLKAKADAQEPSAKEEKEAEAVAATEAVAEVVPAEEAPKEEPKAEEAKEEPKAEEPKAEEPKAEEPKAEVKEAPKEEAAPSSPVPDLGPDTGAQVYKFNVGDFACTMVKDSQGPQPIDLFFLGSDSDTIGRELAPYKDSVVGNFIVLPYTVLHVKTAEHSVLIDTGLGNFAEAFGLPKSTLLDKLRAEGVQPQQVDYVFLTHCHPDHIGTLLDSYGQPAFPNATIVLGKDELALWTSDSPDLCCFGLGTALEKSRDEIAKNIKKFLNQIDASKYKSIGDLEEVIPGVSAYQVKGHTDGGIHIEFSSNGQKLVAVGDSVFHPLYIENPDWGTAFHHHPQDARKTAGDLVKNYADTNTVVYGHHLTFPSVGTITTDDSGDAHFNAAKIGQAFNVQAVRDASEAKYDDAPPQAEETATPETGDVFRFHVGSIEGTVLLDSSALHPVSLFFKGADEEEVKRELAKTPSQIQGDKIEVPYSILHLKTPTNQVLIDTGLGNFSESFGQPQASTVISRLKREGVNPSDIDTVILTHTHLDHIGTLLDDSGRPQFSNATVVVAKDEWDNVTSDNPNYGSFGKGTDMESILQPYGAAVKKVLSGLDQNKVRKITTPTEVVPGVTASVHKGHTAGSMVIDIQNGGQRFVAIGDALMHPGYLNNNNWNSVYHHHPEDARAVQAHLTNDLKNSGARVFGHHFQFPSVGTITSSGDGVQFNAASLSDSLVPFGKPAREDRTIRRPQQINIGDTVVTIDYTGKEIRGKVKNISGETLEIEVHKKSEFNTTKTLTYYANRNRCRLALTFAPGLLDDDEEVETADTRQVRRQVSRLAQSVEEMTIANEREEDLRKKVEEELEQVKRELAEEKRKNRRLEAQLRIRSPANPQGAINAAYGELDSKEDPLTFNQVFPLDLVNKEEKDEEEIEEKAKPKLPRKIEMTSENLLSTAKSLGYDIDESEANEYLEIINPAFDAFAAIDHMPDFLPPVKYERTAGVQPSVDENPHNAWYVKTDIPGNSDGNGILSGKTIALKDNICLSGVQMMCGSAVLEGYTPDVDATVVERILDAGGKILGKATCEDLCWSGGSHTSAKGPVLNPRNTEFSAGGSSSGSAALVANGDVDLALGGDQGGSIRIPASYCGIYGLKPTYGLVPYSGIMGDTTHAVDHVGPMTKNTIDNALLLEAIAGPDGFDSRQGAQGPRDDLERARAGSPITAKLNGGYLGDIDKGVKGLRIGIVAEGFLNCHNDTITGCKTAAKVLQSLGAHVEEISIPLHAPEKSGPIFNSVVRFLGTGEQFKDLRVTSLIDKFEAAWKARSNSLAPTAKIFYIIAKYLEENFGLHYHAKGMNLARKLALEYDHALDEFDILLMPTTPSPAQKLPPADASRKEITKAAWSMLQNTAPFDVTGHPALSIPCGKTKENLPIGLMMVAKKFDERTIYKASYALEQNFDWESYTV